MSEESQKREDVKICIEHLDFSYSGDQKWESKVIADLSLSLRDQEFLTIVGASGCGKSTLLNIITGLLPPSAGTVLLDGKEIRGPGPDRTMVFQDDAVFPWYTVRENVAYGLKISGTSKKEVEQQVKYYLDLVGLSECADYYPRQLSGGMKKRVDVARAMITQPEVLLMDEPFASLDVMTKQRLQEQFLNIWNETRMTVIFVTHDLEEALFLADRVAVMASHPGRIVSIVDVPFGRPREKDLKTSGEFQDLRRKLNYIIDADQSETV
ncbi:ABC transporter related protein [Candidatus Vecturithrix granuli]|uniref:ABC transporter related protein n=1 Tax=Vecturithrix granuli TaxID=1499967 RepID=A0A081C680_VECG1|nr:ABC transporter related protein [Candidatus Vecturithrix granuli]